MMAVAVGKIYRDGTNMMGRAKISGNDTITKFYPIRVGSSLMFRGKNAAGQVVYGYPFRSGNNLFFRTSDGGSPVGDWGWSGNPSCPYNTLKFTVFGLITPTGSPGPCIPAPAWPCPVFELLNRDFILAIPTHAVSYLSQPCGAFAYNLIATVANGGFGQNWWSIILRVNSLGGSLVLSVEFRTPVGTSGQDPTSLPWSLYQVLVGGLNNCTSTQLAANCVVTGSL